MIELTALGGPGSGNHGHAGRPGQVGGSASVFHGTNAENAKLIRKDGFQISIGKNGQLLGSGVYLVRNKHDAQFYGDEVLDVDASGLKIRDFETETAYKKFLAKRVDDWEPETMSSTMQGLGFDGVRIADNVLVVFDPSKLKILGGPGSGNFHHAGRPGQVGGSGSSVLAHPAAVIGFNFQRRGLTEPAKAYIAKHGQEFEAGERPDDVEQGTPNECYRNTSLLVLRRDDLTYVEGYASKTPGGVAMLHAWAVDTDDNVIDPTLADQEKWLYFGVKYNRDAYLKHLFKAQYHGVFGSTDAVAAQVIKTDGAKLRKPLKTLGGPGSGNFGHAGRPGQVGGSAERRETIRLYTQSGGTYREINERLRAGEDLSSHPTVQALEAAFIEEAKPLDEVVYRGIAGYDPEELGLEEGAIVTDLAFVSVATKAAAKKFAMHGEDSLSGEAVGTLIKINAKGVPALDLRGYSLYGEDERLLPRGTKFKVTSVKEGFPGESLNVVTVSVVKSLKALGGPGSGNFGHAGRPGQVGGSGKIASPLPLLKGREIREALANAYQPVIDAYGRSEEIDPREVMSAQKTVFAERVREYQDDPDREADVAPGRLTNTLVIVRRSGKMAVIDGNHRLAAKALAGEKVTATVVDMDRAFADAEAGRKEGEGIGLALMNAAKAKMRSLGGPGSGNFGHAGRPGQVGGSVSFPSGLKKVGGARGSNPGGSYVDEAGQKWYVKNYRDVEQAYGEHLSNGIYQAAGIGTPTSALSPDGKYASKWIEGLAGNVGKVGLSKDVADKILDGFAADVLLSNWDTVGLTRDNIGVFPDGRIVRRDQGGTLLHRAQGALKPSSALNSLSEWDFFSTGNKEYRDVFAAAGVKNGDALGRRAIEQIDLLNEVRPAGGWGQFVEQRVPHASGSWKAKVSSVLETRHKLLLEKRDQLRGLKALGGPGSGNFGHAGRPGQVGGSADARMSDVNALSKAMGAAMSRMADDEREDMVLSQLAPRLAKSDAISTVPFITTGGELDRAKQEAAQRLAVWAKTSGDSVADAVKQQRAVAEEFGLKDAATEHMLDGKGAGFQGASKPGDLDRAFARAEYENTQAWLKENGFTEVTVFRGMYDAEHINAQGMGQGVPDVVNMQPASSWTVDLDTAIDFAQMGGRGRRVLVTKVPASRVLSTAVTGRGTFTEREVLLLGGPTDVLSWELNDASGRSSTEDWQNARAVAKRIETKLGGVR